MTPEEYQKIMLSTWAMTEDVVSTYWHHRFEVKHIAFTCDQDADHRLEIQMRLTGESRDCVIESHLAVVKKKVNVTHLVIVLDKEGMYVEHNVGGLVVPSTMHPVKQHEDMLYRMTLHLLDVMETLEETAMRGADL